MRWVTQTNIHTNTNQNGIGLSTSEKRTAPNSTTTAVLAGLAVGIGVLVLYLIGGIIFAHWSINDFLAHLTSVIAEFLLLSALVIVSLEGPVVAYFRLQVITPLFILGTITIGLLIIGFSFGPQYFFSLATYAAWFSPVYIVLYLVAGGMEYYIQN